MEGDKSKLGQVFNNLPQRRQFNRKGGNVTVASARTEDIEVTVTDTGIGFPEELDKVFTGLPV